MKILFTGGGSGGHFYPIIAVIEALEVLIEEERLVGIKFIFMSDSPYDADVLLKQDVSFIQVKTGKMRRYFSIKNISDVFKTAGGLVGAFWSMYREFPDVVFGKGGYASFPALFAARILGIPVMIHESDVVPGRVNRWAAKFAKRIAISFPESVKYFPAEKTALTGNPVRKEIAGSTPEEAKEVFQLETGLPTLFIYTGSLGSKNVNAEFWLRLSGTKRGKTGYYNDIDIGLWRNRPRKGLYCLGSNYRGYIRGELFDWLFFMGCPGG